MPIVIQGRTTTARHNICHIVDQAMLIVMVMTGEHKIHLIAFKDRPPDLLQEGGVPMITRAVQGMMEKDNGKWCRMGP